MVIYKATNKINGKEYIGQTVGVLEKRKYEHVYNALTKRDSFYFHSAIRKYGPDNFTWTTLHNDITIIDFLNQLEIFYIGYYNTFEDGYNLTEGGKNSKHSEETKRKIGEAQLGEKNHMYGKVGPMLGKHHSEETKKKISRARVGKCVGKKNFFYGKKHTDNTKKKIGIKNSRPIIINNEYYKSLTEAANILNTNKTNIMRRIKRQDVGCSYVSVFSGGLAGNNLN